MELEKAIRDGHILVRPDQMKFLRDTKEPSVFEKITNAVTGEDRMDSQTEATKDFRDMGIFAELKKLAAFTTITSQDRLLGILQDKFPKRIKTSNTAKGNVVIEDTVLGEKGVIQPGINWRDLPALTTQGAITALSALTGGAAGAGVESLAALALREAAVQAGQEAIILGEEGAKGLPTSAANIGLAAAAPYAGDVLGKVASKTASSIGKAVSSTKGAIDNLLASKGAKGVEAALGGDMGSALKRAAAKSPSVQITPSKLSQEETLALLNKRNPSDMAAQAAVNQPLVKRAMSEGIGVEDIPLSVAATSPEIKGMAVAASTLTPGGQGAVKSIDFSNKVYEGLSNILEGVGGASNISGLHTKAKGILDAGIETLKGMEDKYNTALRKEIPPSTYMPLTSTSNYINTRLNDTYKGVKEALSPAEKKILSILGKSDNSLTFDAIKGLRTTIGEARNGKLESSVFGKTDSHILGKLYETLTTDIGNGLLPVSKTAHDLWTEATAASRSRFGLQDRAVELFGKRLDEFLGTSLQGATSIMSKGDHVTMSKLIEAMPEGLRREAMASSILRVVEDSAKAGAMNHKTFSNWYEGVLSNKGTRRLVSDSLGSDTFKRLNNMYSMSRAIRDSLPPAAQQNAKLARDYFNTADGILARIVSLGASWPARVAARVTPTTSGLLLALDNVVQGMKTAQAKHLDRMFNDPKFINLMVNATSPYKAKAVKSFSLSKPWRDFVRESGMPASDASRIASLLVDSAIAESRISNNPPTEENK
jgi:hypothetical protein